MRVLLRETEDDYDKGYLKGYVVYDTTKGHADVLSREELYTGDTIDGVSGDELTFYNSVTEWLNVKLTQAHMFSDGVIDAVITSRSLQGVPVGRPVAPINESDVDILDKNLNLFIAPNGGAQSFFREAAYTRVCVLPQYLSFFPTIAEVWDSVAERVEELSVFQSGDVLCSFPKRLFSEKTDVRLSEFWRPLENLQCRVFSIPESLCEGCASLSAVDLYFVEYDAAHPNVLDNRIGPCAFRNCRALTELRMDGCLLSINHEAFRDCRQLKHVKIPDTVQDIAFGAFMVSGLTEFVAPESLVSVGTCAFGDCSALVRADFSNSKLREVSTEMFTGCSVLQELLLPETVELFCADALYGCTSLKSVHLPSNIAEFKPASLGWGGTFYVKRGSRTERVIRDVYDLSKVVLV